MNYSDKEILEQFFDEERRIDYNNTRKYYRHNRSLTDYDLNTASTKRDILSDFELLDQIENKMIYNALKTLKKKI